MKRKLSSLLLLTAALILGSACQDLRIPTQHGEARIKTFGQKTTIGELSWTDKGALKVKGYNNDQVAAMVELFKAGIEAGKMTTVP